MDDFSGVSATVGDTGGSATPSGDTAPASLDTAWDQSVSELSAGDSPTPDPSDSAASSLAPAPATAVPTETPQAQTPAPETPAGEPPKERWPDILSNARVKEREAVLQQIRTEIGPQLEVLQRLQADPVGTVVQLQQELLADQRYANQIASEAARVLRSQRGVAALHEEPQPDVDAGNGIFLYSAAQQAKREAWLQQQWQRQLQESLSPVQQYVQTAQQREQERARTEQQTQRVTGRFDQWRQMPHFTEHQTAIRAKQQQYYESGMDSWDALARAYAETVVSASRSQGTSELRAQAAKQLQAATANPAASAPAKPQKPRSLDEAWDQAMSELSA